MTVSYCFLLYLKGNLSDLTQSNIILLIALYVIFQTKLLCIVDALF